MRNLSFILLALFIIVSCGERKELQLRVENAWIAEIPPVIRVTAGYMTVHNDSDTPKYLVGVSSSQADSIEIHQSVVVDDIAKMIHQHEVVIPAHGKVRFDSSTGYHLMFYEAKGIKKGNQIPVELKFRDGSTLALSYTVVDRRNLE